MWEQARSARGEDLAFRRRVSQASVPENYIGKDKCAGDCASPGEYAAGVDDRVGVQRCLDFFGVDLGAAYIDYPAASTNEVIAVTASLDHVARIDEAFVIS